jgi:hypothetical protein
MKKVKAKSTQGSWLVDASYRTVALSIIIMLACAFGAVAAEPSDAEAIARAKAAVAKTLKDPNSARYSDIVRKKNEVGTDYVCGKVNAKNSFGAYNGNKIFLYTLKDGKLTTEEYLPDVVRVICGS